jgi:drug/metabolite transporter (DMT)-like permease
MWILWTLCSALSYAGSNVVDSLIVRHQEKSPAVLLGVQSSVSMVFLLVIALVFRPASPWWLLLLCGGFTGYVADYFFFHVIDRLDISVTNAAWAVMAVFLSLTGFLFFGEHWSLIQAAGAGLILGGVCVLSFGPGDVSVMRTILLLAGLGLLSSPFYITQKAAFAAGQTFLPVFFWTLLGRETLACIVAFSVPRFRRRLLSRLLGSGWSFYGLNALVTLLFIGGIFGAAAAYVTGPLSLVGVLANTQPFFVILLAWLTAFLRPGRGPKELLSRQSVTRKVLSFGIVFLGLALLSLSQ